MNKNLPTSADCVSPESHTSVNTHKGTFAEGGGAVGSVVE